MVKYKLRLFVRINTKGITMKKKMSCLPVTLLYNNLTAERKIISYTSSISNLF